jgi:hypothetical protein
MSHIRGLHEARGLGTLRIASSIADRSKLTASLSRLDHQRALLARQLAVWTKKQQVTQFRLGALDQEIAQTLRLIDGIGAPQPSVNQPDGMPPMKSEQQPDRGTAGARRGDMSIDY